MNTALLQLLAPRLAANSQPCIIHAPYLHPEYTADTASNTLPYFSCGLEKDTTRFHCSVLLPFTPAQARAILAEMLEFGRTARTTEAAIIAAEKNFALEQETKQQLKQEFDALNNLENLLQEPNSAIAMQKTSQPATPNKYIAAQKQLILAWYLEEQCLELQAMEQKFTATHTSFSNTLNPEDAAGKTVAAEDKDALKSLLGTLPLEFAYTAELPNPAKETLLETWEKTLWSMKTLAPECLFYIEDSAVTAQIIKKGFIFQEIPKEVYTFLAHFYDVNFLNNLHYTLINKSGNTADYPPETTLIALTKAIL